MFVCVCLCECKCVITFPLGCVCVLGCAWLCLGVRLCVSLFVSLCVLKRVSCGPCSCLSVLGVRPNIVYDNVNSTLAKL